MIKKRLITVAIDSPAAAGAGTQAKLIAKHYNLLHLDTGRIYRLIGKMKLDSPKNFNFNRIKKKIKNIKISELKNQSLLSDKIATVASIIAKEKKLDPWCINFNNSVLIPHQKNTQVLFWMVETSLVFK